MRIQTTVLFLLHWFFYLFSFVEFRSTQLTLKITLQEFLIKVFTERNWTFHWRRNRNRNRSTPLDQDSCNQSLFSEVRTIIWCSVTCSSGVDPNQVFISKSNDCFELRSNVNLRPTSWGKMELAFPLNMRGKIRSVEKQEHKFHLSLEKFHQVEVSSELLPHEIDP